VFGVGLPELLILVVVLALVIWLVTRLGRR
jgi:hypothetical protein